MNRESTHNTVPESLAILGIIGLLVTGSVSAQVPVDDDGYPIQPIDSYEEPATFDDEALPLLTAAELETLVGPVALYPDVGNAEVVMTRNPMFAELRGDVLTFYFLPKDSDVVQNAGDDSSSGNDLDEAKQAFSTIYVFEASKH